MNSNQLAIAPRGEEYNELDGFRHYAVDDEQDGYATNQSAVPQNIWTNIGAQRRQQVIIGQLPMCWVTLPGGISRALIDTGSQLNVMQLSTARTLSICITETDQSTLSTELQKGMVTANGETNPFVGTAYSVPVSISGVMIPTHFRIVERLPRAIILGTPWCSAAQLQVQFDTFGNTFCSIKSIDNQREISFVGCEPAPPVNTLPIHEETKQRAPLLARDELLSFLAQTQYVRVHCSKSFSKARRCIMTLLGQKSTKEKSEKSSPT